MTSTATPHNDADPQPFDTDVLILGAGPVGLTLANLLGGYGVRTTIADAGEKLIDYPRGVGLDDESLRSFQTAGVVAQVLPHTTPQHIMRMVNGKGQVLANVAPGAQDFGWSRRNGFIQPLVDAELLAALVAVRPRRRPLLAHPARLRRRRRRRHRDRRPRRRHHEDHPCPVSRGLRRRPQHHPQVDGRDVRGPVVAHAVPGRRRPQ